MLKTAPRLWVSDLLVERVRLASPRRRSMLPAELGVHRVTLSRYLNRQVRVRRGHPKIVALGRLLGLEPHECFDEGQRG
jgi:hypothetical protein